MRPRLRVSTAIAVFGLVLIASSGAVAQQQEEEAALPFTSGFDVLSDGAFSSSTSSTSTTMSIGLGLYSMQLATGDVHRVRAFIRQNEVSLHHDLHTGGGDASRDLAYLLGLDTDTDGDASHYPAFADVLYDNRHRLGAIVGSPDLDTASTRHFVAVVIDAMADDETLAEEANRLAMQFGILSPPSIDPTRFRSDDDETPSKKPAR